MGEHLRGHSLPARCMQWEYHCQHIGTSGCKAALFLFWHGSLAITLLCIGKYIVCAQAQKGAELHLDWKPKGASFTHSKRKWRSQIMYGGKNHHLGYFDTKQQAMEAYERVSTMPNFAIAQFFSCPIKKG